MISLAIKHVLTSAAIITTPLKILLFLELLLFVLELVVTLWVVIPDAVRIRVRTWPQSLVPYVFLVLAVPVTCLIPDGFWFGFSINCFDRSVGGHRLFWTEPVQWRFYEFAVMAALTLLRG